MANKDFMFYLCAYARIAKLPVPRLNTLIHMRLAECVCCVWCVRVALATLTAMS